MEAFRLLCRTEGIIPAIESSHALAGAIKVGQRLAAEGAAARTPSEKIMIVNLSGRGDKDVATAAEWFDLLDKDSRRGRHRQGGRTAVSTADGIDQHSRHASKSAAAIDRARPKAGRP